MAKNCGSSPRTTYTAEQRIALVTEIARRHRAGGGTLRAIAAELGTTDQNYHNWLKAGIRPAPPPPTTASPRLFDQAERGRLVSEIDRRRAEGASVKAACLAVEVSEKSYRRWKEDAAPPPTMRPVEVTSLVPAPPTALTLAPPIVAPASEPLTVVAVAEATPALTLLAPGGYRIEGLAIETAAQLLRALAC